MNETNHRVGDGKTPDVSHVENPDVAHEHRDVDVIMIVVFGLGLLAMAFVTYVVLWVMFDYFSAREARSRPSPPTLIRSGQQHMPPEPRLQGAPGHEIQPLEELKQMRASEDTILNSYGWVDRQEGTVRIPIEQAMRLLAERGLPSRQEGGGQEMRDQGLERRPEASSSGRTMERKQ